jgi:tetratricopeptide (TPR) repeat protein
VHTAPERAGDERSLVETNEVMKLCMEGMAAEGAGEPDAAKRLFQRAWDAREDDFDACVAAHYLARHQITIEARLEWNERALQHADAVRDDRVTSFYPSLYLTLGASYEELVESDQDYEDVKRARDCFAQAAERAADLPPGGYADMVKGGAAAGLRRAEAILGARTDGG